MGGTTTSYERPDDAGFTLIEVLVVCLIVGILAAIAIPNFTSQKQKAVAASLKADLHNYALYESEYGTQNGRFGSRGEVDAYENNDVHLSSGNMLQVISADDAGFCLRATDVTTTLTWFWDSTAGGLMKKGEFCGTVPSATPTPTPTGTATPTPEPTATATASPTSSVTPNGECKGSGYGGVGNAYCPGSNGNGGVGNGAGDGATPAP